MLPSHLSLFLPQALQAPKLNLDISDILGLVAGIFALVLFAVSMFAWSRRRQRPLLLVSVAFLVFFLKVIIETQPIEGLDIVLVSTLLDVVFLSLFFLAIVARPNKH
jgi:hypothetical protein